MRKITNNEARLLRIVEGSQDGLWDWDLKTGQIFFNHQSYRLLEIPLDTPNPSFNTILDSILPDDRLPTQIAMQALIDQGSAYEVEHHIPLKNGGLRYCLCRGQVTNRDPDGKPAKISGTITDITALKNTQIALQRSQARLNRVLEGSNDGIWDWNLQTNELYWNEQFYHILGLDPKTTKPDFQLILGKVRIDEQSKMQASIEAHLQKQEPYRVEYHLQHSSGEWRNCLCRGKVSEWDEQGNPIWFSGTLTDITYMKQVEQHLQEIQERLNRVIAGSDQGLWEWDIPNDLIYWSDRLFEMLGLPPNDAPITYSAFESLVPKADQSLVNAAMQETLRQGIPFIAEFRMRHASGRYLNFISRAKPYYNKAGEVFRVSGMVTDITHRKEIEEALEQTSRKLAESNHDLEQFAAIASHDLKAPLRKINIFSSQILTEKEKLSPDAQDALERVIHASTHMQMLIDDLLLWSKVGYTPLRLETIALDELLDRVIGNLAPQIEEKAARITVNQTQTILGDPVQIEHLLQNLIENALKYQPPNQVPVINIDCVCQASHICELHVKDNGIGFKPEFAKQIFEPFFRLHGKASPYTGSGIGLSICKRIAERHGGNITVWSEEGKGTVFTVRLPYNPQAVDMALTPENESAY